MEIILTTKNRLPNLSVDRVESVHCKYSKNSINSNALKTWN